MKKSIVFKASIVYIVVSFINKALGLITIPIFTGILTTEEMGIVTTFTAWLSMLTPLVTLSLVTASFFVAMSDFKESREQYQSSILVLTTCSTIIFLVVYLVIRNVLNNILTLPTHLIVIMFLYLMVSPALDIWLIKQRYEYNLKGMAIVTIITSLIPIIVTILAVIHFQNSDYNLGNIRIYFTYGIQATFSLFFYFLIIKKGKILYSEKYWKYAIKLSAPLIVHNIAKSVLDVSDRSMISYLCGKSLAGIYGTIYSVSSLALIVWNAINNAYTPYLFEKLETHQESDARDINTISMGLIIVYAGASICLTLTAPEIVKILMTQEYYEAINIIPAICSGIYLTCVYNLFANVLLYHKKTTSIMKATLIAALFNIITNYVCIKLFSYQAAAYTTLLSCGLLAVMQGYEMKRVHKEKLYDYRSILCISIVTISICVLSNILYSLQYIRYGIIAILCMIFIINRKRVFDLIRTVRNK